MGEPGLPHLDAVPVGAVNVKRVAHQIDKVRVPAVPIEQPAQYAHLGVGDGVFHHHRFSRELAGNLFDEDQQE